MIEQHHIECEYRAIFDGTGDGILVTDQRTGLVQDANPAVCRLSGYTHDELIGIDPIILVHPESRPAFEARVRGREMDYIEDRVPLVGLRRDGATVDVEVQVQTVSVGGSLARLSVVRDVTERVRAMELLEERVRDRTRELSAILEITHAVNGTLELEPLLALVLDRLRTIVDYSEAAIMLREGDELCISDYRGSVAREQIVGIRVPVSSAVVFKAVVERDAPVIIDNLHGEDPLAVEYRARPERITYDPWLSQQSVLAVPLKVAGKIIGHLRLDHDQVNFYTRRHADLAVAFANQAATAIGNARLFENERRSRQHLELALEAGQMGTWDWDRKSGRVTWSPQYEAIRGIAPGTFAQTFDATFLDIHPDDVDRVRQTIDLSLESGAHHVEYRIVRPDGQLRWLESRGRVVRDADNSPLGMRGVCMDVTARKDAEEERNQLIAREQAANEAKVTLEERQKLARELHDSVSQSLYGIGTAAQTARSALEEDHDPVAALKALEYVVRMADVGLAEMRELIAELRPETLAQEGLVAALERYVASIRARNQLEVDAQLGAEPEMPLSAKEALFRIAREALHNVVKHAQARSARLSIRSIDDTLVLVVADDGVGFDPAADYPGHLGLTSMKERARAAGGQLSIVSSTAGGTQITAEIPLDTGATVALNNV